MAESLRVYCTSCEQTFVANQFERCPLCRTVGNLVDADTKQNLAPRKTEPHGEVQQNGAEGDSPVSNVQKPISVGRVWVVLKLTIAGFIMFMLAGGFTLMILTERPKVDNPSLSWRDLQLPLYPFAGGIICVVALLLFRRHWKRADSAEQTVEKDGNR